MPLKRTLTLPLLTLYGLGNILGAGIYVLIGKVSGVAGMMAPLSFFCRIAIGCYNSLYLQRTIIALSCECW